MMFSFQDKQCMDLKHLFNTDPPKYKDPTKYMNHPDMLDYEMKGAVKQGMKAPDRSALVRFYLENIPALKGLWATAVSLYANTHSAAEKLAAGIKWTTSGFVFESQAHMYNFFNDHFAGEQRTSGS